MIRVIQSNARNLPLGDDSVDLVVTSPPYFALRSYQDDGEHYAEQIGSESSPAEFVDALAEVTRECVRVLKPSGSLWVNLGDKYAGSGGDVERREDTHGRRTGYSGAKRGTYGFKTKTLMGIPWRYALRCIDDLGLILRAEVIWAKPNGMPESVTDRVRRSHEQWFHFTLGQRYFSDIDAIRESSLTTTRGKLPGSVWTIPSEPLRVPAHLGVEHFAAFPTEWPRRIIRAWSPLGGVVLDPFGGSGTTALVAHSLGRTGISIDLSADYCRLAEWRTRDPYEQERCAAKNEGRKPRPTRVIASAKGDGA